MPLHPPVLVRWILAAALAMVFIAATAPVRMARAQASSTDPAQAPPKDSPSKKPAQSDDQAELFFESDVHPILRTHCLHCHGEQEELSGGLDLRLRRFALAGGESGPAIEPGEPQASLMLQRLVDGDMPPEETSTRPTKKEIETIRLWLASGAKTKRAEPETLARDDWITEEDRRFWSFLPIRKAAPPEVKNSHQVETPIDRFVLARLEPKGFRLSAAADRATFIRRATFDLHGLPPTLEEIRHFEEDESANAHARLIDRLLASPRYGERWSRHWLDTAGYADSEGVDEKDTPRAHAWKYRDFVIRSLNQNRPLDEFIRWQLAGDELIGSSEKLTPDDVERLEATGFLRMAPDGTATANNESNRNEMVADTIKIVTSSLLGMTVGCAQCHNHRYDPISQKDYYQLRAVFDPALDLKRWKTPKQRLVSLYNSEKRKKAAEIEAKAKAIDKDRVTQQNAFIAATFEKELAKLPEDIRADVRAARDTPEKKRSKEQKTLLRENPSVNVTAGSLYLYDKKAADKLKKMQAEATKLRSTKPVEEFVRSLGEPSGAKPPESFVFLRGDVQQPGEKVQPQALSILGAASIPDNDPSLPTTGRRLAYANWLTSGDHPLTARVLVNRVWMHHFGVGIVATPSDFGRLGSPASHPQLLDWLAANFMESGWNLKSLHRQIMLSAVYRQSSVRKPELDAIDSQNRLLGRMSIRRLDAESFRDSLLTLSGQLLDKRFGPPIPVMADRVGQWVIGKENLNAGRPGAVIAMKGEDLRRSIYVQARRSRPLALLDTFDLPAMTPNCDKRPSSTVATQSLMLMNGNFVARQASALAKRLKKEAGEATQQQVELAWTMIFGQRPNAEDVQNSLQFVQAQSEYYLAHPPRDAKGAKNYKADDAKHDAISVWCQAMLSSNGFLYVD